MTKRQTILIVIVIAIGAVLAGLILTWDNVARPEATRVYNDKSHSSQAGHKGHNHGDHEETDSTNRPHAHPEIKDKAAGEKSKSREPSKGPKGGNFLPRKASA